MNMQVDQPEIDKKGGCLKNTESGIIVGFIAEKVQTRWLILVMGISWAVYNFQCCLVVGQWHS